MGSPELRNKLMNWLANCLALGPRSQRLQGALALLQMMAQRQLQPTVVTFAAAVEASAVGLLQSLQELQQKSLMAQACGAGLLWGHALAILQACSTACDLT